MTTPRPNPLATALASAGIACMLLANGTASAATRKPATASTATLSDLEKKIDALIAQNKALADKVENRFTPWGVNSAETRREAEDLALQACQASGEKCKVREWVCT